MHEAKSWQDNSFITLTYDDQHLPKNKTLQYRDWQLFMKRLRRWVERNNSAVPAGLGAKTKGNRPESEVKNLKPVEKILKPQIRFYMSGEYGDRTQRPHYHAAIFNLKFPDEEYFRKAPSGEKMYTSQILNRLWGNGVNNTTGELTFESAAYIARYIIKKQNGKNAKEKYEKTDPETGEIIERKKEFSQMSRRPGLGNDWLNKYTADVYPRGKVVIRGHEAPPPRYYDKQYKKMNPTQWEKLRKERRKLATATGKDRTPARLSVRKAVKQAQLRQLKRTLE